MNTRPRSSTAERFGRWLDSGATGLTLHTRSQDALDLVASLHGAA